MAIAIDVFDPEKRALAKQASRELDALRLDSGEVSRADLARTNGFFSSLPVHEFRIVAVGKRRLK